MKHPHNLLIAFLLGLFASFFFVGMGLCVKKIGTQLPTPMILFFRFLFGFLFISLWRYKLNQDLKLNIKLPLKYFTRPMLSMCAIFFFFYSVKFIPLTAALVLVNTGPLFIPLIIRVLAGEKTKLNLIFFTLIGFLGVIFILHPSNIYFIIENEFIPVLSGIFSGFLNALIMLQNHKIAKNSQISEILFYFFLICALASLVISAWQWESPSNLEIWKLILGVGSFGLLYQICSILSHSCAPIRLTSPLAFLSVLNGYILDIWFSRIFPDIFALIGLVLIIIGVSSCIYLGKKEIISGK